MVKKIKLSAADYGMKFKQTSYENFIESLMDVDFNNRNEESKYK